MISKASTTFARVDVVARGLNNPRGVTLGPAGLVLVAEAGTGGHGPCMPSPEGGESYFGTTGSLTVVGFGHQRRVVTGLPSLADRAGRQASGFTGVTYGPAGLTGVIGLGGDPAQRAMFGPAGRYLATLVALTPGGSPRILADLGDYGRTHNPDRQGLGSSVDANPYAIAPAWDGGAVVADAGGNTLLGVDPLGRVSTLAVFHTRTVPGPGGAPVPMQAVPDSVVRAPGGGYYVGQLTGFPFPVGGASVFLVRHGSRPVVVASGFTNIIGVDVDRRGRLYVLEISRDGLGSGHPAGALWRVDGDGHRTELAADRLTAPGGLAVTPDGTVYVTNNSTSAGTGELLRISQ